MAKVYEFLADGLEEVEAITPVDFLRRAGNDVTTVSVMGQKKILGSHKIYLAADAVFEELSFEDGDLFILPGGGLGTRNLSEHKGLRELLNRAYKDRKRVAAICAAPSVFGSLGFVNGKKATVYPGMENTLTGADPVDVAVVTDGTVTTGHGPGAAMEFALELVRLLNGEAVEEKLREQLVFQRKLDHVTINVKDMHKSEEFYAEVIGLQKLYNVDMGDHQIHYFSLGGDAMLELIQYDVPDGEAHPAVKTKGILRHLAIRTSQLDAIWERAKTAGVKVNCEPGYVEKLRFRNFLIEDPNGVELEILQRA